jgi:23S rRNA (uracil1939-C5)-methyltransferase
MVTVVARKANVPFLKDLSQKLIPLGVRTLVLNVNPEATNVILGSEYLPVYGEGFLHDQILGLDFELSPASFFQVNVSQTEKLYSLALQFADLTPSQTAFDVYCGTGTISLLLARQCRQVIGIEVVPQAVENAKKNASANQITNAEFYTGTAESMLPKLVSATRADVIVVDPPRKGLDASVIQTIADVSPDRVVYVSCNPATLARDAALFLTHGFHIEKVQPVDMFCWTSDVETVCLLSKLKSTYYIDVDLDLSELDVTQAEAKATYDEIKAYVFEHTGLQVSNLYIAQVKAKHGIIERNCYNKPKTEGNKVPKCPPDKEKAIENALRHFQMIKKEA